MEGMELADRLLDHLPDGIVLVEAGRVSYANARAAEILGISQRRLRGADVAAALPQGTREVVDRILGGASSCTSRNLSWDRPGAAHRVTVKGSPGPDTSQVVLVLLPESTAPDHEARVGFRDRLAWLDGVAAGVAHEVRNPLGVIRGAAQLLARRPDPEEMDELCRLVIRESDRIDAIVEQLMSLTRPRSLQRQPISLNRLVHDEVALLDARARGAAVKWQLDLDPSLPPVEGDPERLRGAVSNLLRNAVEASRSTVQVRTRVEPEGRLLDNGHDRGLALRLDVVDDGDGIDPARVPGLFAPFATTKPEGTGLGLFLARLAMDEHGGLLRVDPRPGLGARFSLVLWERLGSGPEATGVGRPRSGGRDGQDGWEMAASGSPLSTSSGTGMEMRQ